MATANDSIMQQNPGIITIPDTVVENALPNLENIIAVCDSLSHSAVYNVTLTSTISEIPDKWTSGMEGSSRQGSLTGNSGILTIIVIMFVMLSMNFKECRKLFSRFTEDLRSDKKRENAFDERTSHETRLTLLTVTQFIVYAGIILCGAVMIINRTDESYMGNFIRVTKCIGLVAGYYIFQLCAYSLTGYTFAGKKGNKKWIRALNATQSMAGIALMIPALMILFYPGSAASMITTAAIIYIIARLIFIYKGFSIFYKNIFSLVYFILYLCTLEIIPVIYVFKLALLDV